MGEKLIRVMDLKYRNEDDDVIIELVGRDAVGERFTTHIKGTRPYCFVPEQRRLPDEDYILDTESGFKGHDDTPLQKVTVQHPSDVNTLKKEYNELPYEADIPYIRRVGIDYGLSGYIRVPNARRCHIEDIETSIDSADVQTIEPRVVMADIETLPPGEHEDWDTFVEEAEQAVTAITAFDTYDEEYIALVLDPDDIVDGRSVKRYIDQHWRDHEFEDDMTDGADITLKACQDEETLLKSFIDWTDERRPDLLSGWNWVDFDHEYLLNRFRNFDNINEHRLSDIGSVGGFKTAQKIDGLPGFDMMEAYCGKMTFHEWRSESLDYVTHEELNVGKVEDVNVGKEYRENRNRFLAYNIIDTQLLVAMDETFGIHEFFYQLADLSSIQIYDTFSEMRLVDGFVMSHRNDDEILPSTEEKNLDAIPGGLVLTPSTGVHEWVAVLDLKSLYPSEFITLNVSEETIVNDVDPNKVFFEDGEVVDAPYDALAPEMPVNEESNGGEITNADIKWDVAHTEATGTKFDHEGVLPKYLKLLFDERAAMKAKRDEFDPHDAEYEIFNNRQRAIKVVMNSFYGVTQNDYYRLSAPGLGSTITAAGRYTLWKGAEVAREMGFNVRYGDTDSIMIELAEPDEDVTPQEVVDRGMKIEDEINEAMDEVADEFGIPDEHPYLVDAGLHGTDRHCLHWEFEKLYRRFLQAGTKKRYAGLEFWEEGKWLVDPENPDLNEADLDVKGFEYKRANVPEVTAEIQGQILQRVLFGQAFDEVSGYLKGTVEKIEEMKFQPHEIATPGVINKPLEDYPNRLTPRACEYSNEHLGTEWREGDDPWIYHIDSTPPMVPDTDAIALEWGEDVPDGFEIDLDTIITKKVKKPLEPILQETGWSFEELKTGRQTQGIDAGGGGNNPFQGQSNPGAGPADNPFAGSSDADSDNDEDDESQKESQGALEW